MGTGLTEGERESVRGSRGFDGFGANCSWHFSWHVRWPRSGFCRYGGLFLVRRRSGRAKALKSGGGRTISSGVEFGSGQLGLGDGEGAAAIAELGGLDAHLLEHPDVEVAERGAAFVLVVSAGEVATGFSDHEDG